MKLIFFDYSLVLSKNTLQCFFLYGVVFVQLANAQPLPDAGSIQNQIERARPAAVPSQRVPQGSTEKAEPVPGNNETVAQVRTFRFIGNSLISTERLQSAVSGYLSRPLSFNDLQAAALDIARLYRDDGWLVRAFLPQQDITDGNVSIQIVEAVLGDVQLDGPGPWPQNEARIQKMVSAQQKVGAPLRADAIDRALLLMDDLPGLTVSGALVPGQSENTTNLALKLGQEPLLIGDASVDNFGSRSTGDKRISANLLFNSPLQTGELLSANAVHTQGSDYLRLAGSFPVGYDGWKFGVSAAHLHYRLIAPEFTELRAKGISRAVGLEANYPLVRSQASNLYLNANLDNKHLNNSAGGNITSRYSVQTSSLGLSGNLFDKLGGGGANSASLALVGGRLDLDGSPSQTGDAATTRSAGHYKKLRLTASRQQVVSDSLSAFAALAGQKANKNLDSAEKFYLGGASGVRAYPASEGGGSEGYLINLELRWRLSKEVTLTGFYDRGHVLVNRDNQFNGAPALNAYSLHGAGMSMAWQAASGIALKATWARRLGHNPNPAANGNDQDGSLVKHRFWLLATLPF